MLLRPLWVAPPELPTEDPHKWWNLIAKAGIGGGASREAWSKVFAEPSELLIFAPSDLAELRAVQLHIVSDSEEYDRLLRQLWRAVKASGDARDFSERADPSIYVCRGWGAIQFAGAVAANSGEGSEFGGFFCFPRRGARPDHGGMRRHGSAGQAQRGRRKRVRREENRPVRPGGSSA